MGTDRSHDGRSAADSSAGPDGTDPWSEFLSESSEELQQLQSTRSTALSEPGPETDARGPGISIVPVPGGFDTAPFAPESPSLEVPSLELPSAVAGDTAPAADESLSPSVPVDPAPAIEAPVSPLRDGAPPFTRRFTTRSYEAPVPVAPSRPPELTPSPLVPPVGDGTLSQTTATMAEERASLILPEPLSPPTSSIWRTPSDVAHPEHGVPGLQDERVVATVAPAATARESAPAPSTASKSPASSKVTDSICVSDVLSRQTPVQWPEAVATVEALCAALETDETGQVLIPDLADVFITSTGAVGVREGAAGETDVAALGRALHALLATSTTPLPLRLFVTSAISSDRFASVALFADALSYYAATSARTPLIQALYQRAVERPAGRAVVTPRPQLPRPEPEPIGRVENRRRVNRWALAAAAGVAVCALAGVWLWAAGLPSTDADRAAGNASAPSTQKRTEDWTPGPILVEPGPETAPAAPVSSAPRVDSRPAPRAPRTAATLEPSVAAPTPASVPSIPPAASNTQPAPAAMAPLPQPVNIVPVPAVSSPPPPPPQPPASRPAVVADSKVYSADDLDVDPPVLLSPMLFLPAPLSPGERTVTRTLELVIDTGGRVQSAKLLDEPRRLSDFNVTQQAKLLRFRAALKDGRTVMYRHRMRLTPAPN